MAIMVHHDGRYDPEIENVANQIDKPFAIQIIGEIGVKYIEHSKHNGVKVKCTQTVGGGDTPVCYIDRGGGWQPLTVS